MTLNPKPAFREQVPASRRSKPVAKGWGGCRVGLVGNMGRLYEEYIVITGLV